MSAAAISRRLVALENSTPAINSLADYALWRAHGRDPKTKWDPIFKKQLKDAFSKMKLDRLQRETEKARL